MQLVQLFLRYRNLILTGFFWFFKVCLLLVLFGAGFVGVFGIRLYTFCCFFIVLVCLNLCFLRVCVVCYGSYIC